MSNSDKKYLTTKEAAEYLGLSIPRIKQFCQGGQLGQKLNGSWAITLDELENFNKIDRKQGWYSHKEHMPVPDQIKIKIRKWLNELSPDWDMIKELCDQAKGENEE